MNGNDRFYPWVRQFTGQAWRFRSYVRERGTNAVVAACPHKHRRRRGSDLSGEVYARRCAERMVRSMNSQPCEAIKP